MSPIVSVIIPVFNCDQYVSDSIKSILSQNFSNLELIVINDGSTDGSWDIIQNYAKQDERIRFVSRENKGLVYSLNEGISLSRSDLICRMDADDVSLPERIACQVRRFEESAGLLVLGTQIIECDRDLHALRVSNYPVGDIGIRQLLKMNHSPFAHPTVMMRRSAIRSVGGYRSQFSHCEDYDLWLRLSELNGEFGNLDEAMLRYRRHSESVSKKHSVEQMIGTVVANLCHREEKVSGRDPIKGKSHFSEIKKEELSGNNGDLLEFELWRIKSGLSLPGISKSGPTLKSSLMQLKRRSARWRDVAIDFLRLGRHSLREHRYLDSGLCAMKAGALLMAGPLLRFVARMSLSRPE